MQVFDFPLHTLSVEYPESSVKLRYGRGYEFASRPSGPDQITYILHFKAMWFFLDLQGYAPLEQAEVYDLYKHPQINMARLERFYQAHRLYEPFWYPHPSLGKVRVRFQEPLRYKILEGGQGQTEPFDIKLLSQP